MGALPVLRRFLVVDPGLDLTVKKRGMEPEGGGEVVLVCPTIRQLKPILVSLFIIQCTIPLKLSNLIYYSKILILW